MTERIACNENCDIHTTPDSYHCSTHDRHFTEEEFKLLQSTSSITDSTPIVDTRIVGTIYNCEVCGKEINTNEQYWEAISDDTYYHNDCLYESVLCGCGCDDEYYTLVEVEKK